MKPNDEDRRKRYFAELTIAMKREGLEMMPPEDGLLPVLLDGQPICQISGGGSVRYRPEDMVAEPLEHALQKATDIAETVSEYPVCQGTMPLATLKRTILLSIKLKITLFSEFER